VNRNACFVVGVVLLLVPWLAAGKEAGQGQPANTKKSPTIRLNREAGHTKAVVEVVNLERADLERLAKAKLEASQWTALFAVYVDEGNKIARKDRPAMLGSYDVRQNVLRFEPRYPLTPGIRYRAVFDPSRLPGQAARHHAAIEVELIVPKPKPLVATVVRQVYPSGNKLPENHLRFYLHFSAPMSRGEAYQHIRLLDAAGKPIEQVFLELDEELWDPQGQRFTLFFHPGRVKKGLKPREELGPILEEGKTYTLVIDRQWNDAQGNPLKESYRKTFQAVAAEEKSPDPKTWKIQAPPAGTVASLAVRFPKPLDHALLENMLWVANAQDRKVAGKVAITDAETCWQFTPEQSWQVGTYHLVADTRLEDLAGNSIERPFEVDVFRPIQRELKTSTIKLPFQVQAAGPSK
jgi:hypothetical protein